MEPPQKSIKCTIDELTNIQLPVNTQFDLTITKNNIDYEFKIHLKDDSDKLLVLAPDAIRDTSHDRTKPYYERLDWNFTESTIHFNDPTTYIHDDIKGGWGIGTMDDWYLKNISQIIQQIAQKIYKYKNTNKYTNILFYGSKMGAFMALTLAILTQESIAIVEMPKTKVFDRQKESLITNIFQNKSLNEINNKFGHRINIFELIKKEEYIPNTYIITNLNKKYITLFKKLGKLPFIKNQKNKIHIRLDNENTTQKPLESYELRNLIHNINKLNDTNYFTESQLLHKKVREENQKISQYQEELTIQLQEAQKNNQKIQEYEQQLQTEKEKLEQNNKTLEENTQKLTEKVNKIKTNTQKLEQLERKFILSKKENIEQEKQIQEKTQENQELTTQIQENNKTHTQQIKELEKKNTKTQTKLDQSIKYIKQYKTLLQQYKTREIKREDQLAYNKISMDYYQLKTTLKKKLTQPLPYIYIILKSRKNTTTNIKLHRKIQKNRWLDIGYYLSKNKDLKRDKWCKWLTPETHYICYGIDEKRKPYENYTQPLNRQEILQQLK
ncbi:hypothetical protein [Methanosphaera sp. WGK6]|uniref:hypothetical protein n=1 Tax=Methanosphaera sp. WGK6 TaxID=1561964 RepID=UPI00084C576F|nr:hypothetical protein [Methanosphaera sp. WGK6]OED29884.1 hypothetical protein NL43_05575 [Methanosphaera sp. WGK6]